MWIPLEKHLFLCEMITTVLQVSSNMHTKVSWCTCSNWTIIYKYVKRFQATGSIQHSKRTQENGCWIWNISTTMFGLTWIAHKHICIISTIRNKTTAFASPTTQKTVVHQLNKTHPKARLNLVNWYFQKVCDRQTHLTLGLINSKACFHVSGSWILRITNTEPQKIPH